MGDYPGGVHEIRATPAGSHPLPTVCAPAPAGYWVIKRPFRGRDGLPPPGIPLLTINRRHLCSFATPQHPITATTRTRLPAATSTYEVIGYVPLVSREMYLCFSMTLHTPTASTDSPAAWNQQHRVLSPAAAPEGDRHSPRIWRWICAERIWGTIRCNSRHRVSCSSPFLFRFRYDASLRLCSVIVSGHIFRTCGRNRTVKFVHPARWVPSPAITRTIPE